jgi:hypothetical protein
MELIEVNYKKSDAYHIQETTQAIREYRNAKLNLSREEIIRNRRNSYDDMYMDGEISLEEYGQLVNKLYREPIWTTY